MKKKTTLTVLFTFVILIALPQTRLDMGIMAVPSYSTINTEGHDIGFKYVIPFNYGFSVAYKKKNVSFSSGIIRFAQGTCFEVKVCDANNPEGGIGTSTVNIKVKAILIPLCFNYILKSKKNEFFGGIGIYSGYIYSQQIENPSISENFQPPSYIIYAGGPPKRFNDIEMFDKLYCGTNIGIGLQHFFNKKLSFLIRPNFLFQLRKELPKDQSEWTNRMMTYSFDMGLFYSFGNETKLK